MSRNPWCPPNPQCHSPISWQECRLLQHQQRKPRRRKIGNGSVILCSKTNSFKSLVSGIEKDRTLSLSFIYWCHCWLENIDNLFLKEHFKESLVVFCYPLSGAMFNESMFFTIQHASPVENVFLSVDFLVLAFHCTCCNLKNFGILWRQF